MVKPAGARRTASLILAATEESLLYEKAIVNHQMLIVFFKKLSRQGKLTGKEPPICLVALIAVAVCGPNNIDLSHCSFGPRPNAPAKLKPNGPSVSAFYSIRAHSMARRRPRAASCFAGTDPGLVI